MKQHDKPRINVMINFFIMSDLRLFLLAWLHALYPFVILFSEWWFEHSQRFSTINTLDKMLTHSIDTMS